VAFMKDNEIDQILKQAAQAPQNVDPALLDRIAKSIEPSLAPVRPLPTAWMLAAGLFLICAAVGVAGAARLGFFGIHKLGAWERALIFPALGILLWLGARSAVGEMIPGSRRHTAAGALLGTASLALVAVFAILFRDYHTDQFVSQGVKCLTAGVLHAIPAALASWLLLRRGFAVNPVAAGLVMGTLAGLAGVTMLELHCANLEAPHVMLWHTAVIPVSAAAAAFVAWVARFRARAQ
jgi:hypothetical protein